MLFSGGCGAFFPAETVVSCEWPTVLRVRVYMELFKNIQKMGEKQINALAMKLSENELFIKAVTQIVATKQYIDQQSDSVLKTVNITSTVEARNLKNRLGQVDRQIKKLEKRIEALEKENASLKESDSTETNGEEKK